MKRRDCPTDVPACQRRREVAAILAAGLLRYRRTLRMRTPPQLAYERSRAYRRATAVTIARTPALTASGRCRHAAATWAKSCGILGVFSTFSSAR